jgi:glycosyltransferase involved in cell wall biosynthesis
MKKIAIDARIINSSTGRYIERLLTHLQKIDTENEYIVLVRKKDYRYWKPVSKNFSVRIADYKNYSLGEQIGFAIFLYRLNVDLVHFCMPQQPILYLKPCITSIHDLTLLKTYNSDKNWLIYHFKQFIGRGVFWWAAHKSRYILTISDYSRNDILSRYKISPLKVIRTYLAADKNSSSHSPYPLPSKNFLLYVGQQSDYKNVRGLILAHQQLLAHHPDLWLVLVGSKSGSTAVNKGWVKTRGYQQVLFTGFVNDGQLAWLYSHTKAYVFPSFMEGFGLPSLEAMLYGAPVVSSNATCLPEINGDAALYFNPHSSDDMAKTIDRVLTNKDRRAELVENGYERVKHFSWNETARETLTTYQAALRTDVGS